MIDWRIVFSLGLGLLVGHILIVIFDALLGLARRDTRTSPS